MNDNQKLRIYKQQAPIDVWSNREKLALATGVQKIGNQNWGPVCRLMKPFAEKDRPSDWLNTKFCALQYNDMFDKIETPKRKRGERGEETTQDLIVKKYTTERLEELNQELKQGFNDLFNLENTLEKLKNKNHSEEFFKSVVNKIREKEKKKKEDSIARQKWLKEREIKISQIMSRLRPNISNKQPNKTENKDIQESKTTTTTLQTTPIQTAANDKEFEFEINKNDTTIVDNSIATTSPENSPNISIVPVPVLSPKKETLEEVVETKHDKNIEKPQEIENKNVVEQPKPIEIINVETDGETKTINDKISNVDANQPVTVEKINIEVTNEESSETNETVVDENTGSTEKNNDETNVVEQPTIKTEPEFSNTTEMEIVNDQTLKLQEVAETSIADEQIITTSKIIDQIKEEITTPIEKVGRNKRKRISNVAHNSKNNNVIQTRSTRSQNNTFANATNNQNNQEPMETPVASVKEEPSKHSKKRTPSTAAANTSVIEEPSNNFSEESNESKTHVLETVNNKIENDVDTKWKRTSLVIVRAVQNHRSTSLIARPLCDSFYEEYRDAIYKDVNINQIKKRIESGQLRNNDEFKRDLMLLFANSIALNVEPANIKALIEFTKETLDLFETAETQKIKTREKNNTPKAGKIIRRQTRGSISNEIDNTVKRSKK